MRKSVFGDFIVESVDDDMGEALMDHDTGDLYALVTKEDGKYAFEIQNSDDGESVVTSEAIFETAHDAKVYLVSFGIREVQFA